MYKGYINKVNVDYIDSDWNERQSNCTYAKGCLTELTWVIKLFWTLSK